MVRNVGIWYIGILTRVSRETVAAMRGATLVLAHTQKNILKPRIQSWRVIMPTGNMLVNQDTINRGTTKEYTNDLCACCKSLSGRFHRCPIFSIVIFPTVDGPSWTVKKGLRTKKIDSVVHSTDKLFHIFMDVLHSLTHGYSSVTQLLQIAPRCRNSCLLMFLKSRSPSMEIPLRTSRS